METVFNIGCKECKHAPTTYEEYCMKTACPNAYTEKAQYCGNYGKSEADKEQEE